MKKAGFIALVLLAALALAWVDLGIMRAEYHFREGDRDLERSDPAAALQQYELAAAILPRCSSYQRAVGRTSLKLYEPGSGNLRPLHRSRDAYSKVVEFDALYPYGWFELAEVLDEFERAKVPGMPSPEPYYRRAVEIDPANPRFLAGLLDFKLRHGRKEAAWTIFFRLIRSYPPAIITIAPALVQTDQDFARLDLEIGRDSPAALEYARFLIRSRRMEQAQTLLEGIKGGPDTRLAVAGMMADVVAARGDSSQARDILTKAVALAPNDFSLSWRLAEVLSKEGDAKGAVSVYRKLLKMHPERWDLASKAAMLAMSSGLDGEAIEMLSAMLASGKLDEKTTIQTYLYRAGVKVKMRELGSARADYERILEIDPKNADADMGIKKVDYELRYGNH